MVVYSDYRKAGVTSLPGAETDLHRVSTAFASANFTLTKSVDPSLKELTVLLNDFKRRSKEADVAAIYATGHGIEHHNSVYLIPNNYPLSDGPDSLPTQAINISCIGEYLDAKESNFLFFGGCRTYYWPEG